MTLERQHTSGSKQAELERTEPTIIDEYRRKQQHDSKQLRDIGGVSFQHGKTNPGAVVPDRTSRETQPAERRSEPERYSGAAVVPTQSYGADDDGQYGASSAADHRHLQSCLD